MLRCITYLAPSLPIELFEAVVGHLGETLGCATELRSEPRFSGPLRAEDDPFAAGDADLAFLCLPSLLFLTERAPPSAELCGAALAFDDPRCDGRALYFSELVVARAHPAEGFEDLEGARVAYNDACSLSGYFNLLKRALETEAVGGPDGPRDPMRFFGALVASGSHVASLDLIRRGEVDAAAIDSNVLALLRRAEPAIERDVRVIESWGPYPVQPIAVSTALPAERRAAIARALLAAGERAPVRGALARFGVRGFARVSDALYESERATLAACRRWEGGPEC